MKFGSNLPQHQVPEWAGAYIKYKALKKHIKTAAQPVDDGTGSQPTDLTEFLYALDRNLEDVDAFYNRKYAEDARRLNLLRARYDLSFEALDALDGHEIEDLRDALLELRDQQRKLAWFGEVNRKGFIKITKKLDKKMPQASTQPQYLASKVDLKPFANNAQLEQDRKVVTEWLATLGRLDANDEARSVTSTQSLQKAASRAPSMSLSKSLLEDFDRAIREDDSTSLDDRLIGLESSSGEPAMQHILLEILQRAIVHRSRAAIACLLKRLKTITDPGDINGRNCIHRLVITIGRTKSPESADATVAAGDEPRYITLATTRPKTRRTIRLESPTLTLDDETVQILAHILDHLQPSQREALASQDSYGRSPLHYAAQYGLVVVCQLLVEHMQSLAQQPSQGISRIGHLQDHEGYAPIHLAVLGGHFLTTKTLLPHSNLGEAATDAASATTTSPSLLTMATSADHVHILQLLVDANADINRQDEVGESALHIAARYGLVECAKILLKGNEAGPANIEIAEKLYSWTPLHIASVDGHLNMVELLVSAGANVCSTDVSGWTAQEHAALRGYLPIAGFLKEARTRIANASAATGLTRLQTNGIASLHSSRSSPLTASSSKGASKSIKSYGHKYLTDESMVLVSLGSMNTSKDFPAVNLSRIPLTQAHASELDTALSIVVSAKGADGDATIIDLPVRDNICTEPIAFTTSRPHDVRLLFDIVPTYSGSRDRIYGRGIAILSSVKPHIGHNRMSLRGDVSVPILSRETMEDIGVVNFNFLVITPFSHANLNVASHHTYWKELTSTMVIGHRGLGKNMTSNRSLQLGENTVQSFIAAANLGANYVEFDVQLTKDHVPVVYHDFLVSETGIDVPVHALTLDQFLHVHGKTHSPSRTTSPDRSTSGVVRGFDRPRSHSYGVAGTGVEAELVERMKHTRDFKAKGFKGNMRGNFIQAPYTTLEELLRVLPADVGFNIELKYAMLHESEEQDMGPVSIELNAFVDAVLKVVYDLGEQRKVIFSSFNPDVCLLLSFKQPNIPVLFLTDAGSLPVGDVRACSLQEAIRFANRWNLLGIVSEAQVLCNSPRLVRVVKDSGLVCVSYGTLNNNPEDVQAQVDEGIDAVIVDSVLKIRNGLIKSSAQKTSPATTSPESLKDGKPLLTHVDAGPSHT